MGGHGDDPWPGTVAGDAVYQLWRSVTGWELSPAARQEFASRAAALSLAEVDGPELAAAARRVFGVCGKLLLADWREEIDEPGLAGLRAVSGEWEGDTESAALTLRTEIAHLIESALSARDQPRPVLRRRLGLDGEQGLTLAALGAEYGVTRERIRQLQVRQLAQPAARARRSRRGSRRGAVLREVIRGLADRGGQSHGAALDEIAGLVFPEAGSDLRLHTLAVLARYPAQVQAQLAAQAAQARDQRRAARREQAAQARAGKRLRRLLAAAQWPPQPVAWHGDGRGDYQRTREVGDRENSGQFRSAKLGRAVAYESGLERRFLQLCEASPDVTWYQEQPLVIPYTCAGTRREYHPDVLVQLADGRRLLAELKHLFEMATALSQAKHAAAWHWCRAHGAGLLITDLSVTHTQLMQRTIPPQTVAVFAARLARSPLPWPEVHALQLSTGMSARDLTACCLRHGWIIDTTPWRLRRR
jgi:TnsA-like endonuclease N terminal/Sigma-70, region 4